MTFTPPPTPPPPPPMIPQNDTHVFLHILGVCVDAVIGKFVTSVEATDPDTGVPEQQITYDIMEQTFAGSRRDDPVRNPNEGVVVPDDDPDAFVIAWYNMVQCVNTLLNLFEEYYFNIRMKAWDLDGRESLALLTVRCL